MAPRQPGGPGLATTENLGSFSLRALWQLTNRPQPVYGSAVRAACLILLVFYAIISIIRHTPEPAVLWLRAMVLVTAGTGVVWAPRFSWSTLRLYTVALALLLPSTTAAIEILRGNHPADLALTALAIFSPTVFLLSAADVLLVGAVLGCAILGLNTNASPPGVPIAVTGIVLGGALVSGAVTALVLIAFRNRISESTVWWQQACARERTLREFVELAVPHLGSDVLAGEFAVRFRRAFGTGHCAIILRESDGGAVRVAATAGLTPCAGAPSPSAAALDAVLAAVGDRQPLVNARVSREEAEQRFADLKWLTIDGALVVLPIVVDAAVAGAVVLSAAGPHPVPGEDLLLWRAMANQIGVAVGSARLFARLQQALRARSEFVNTMSHALRSPLHVILGYAEMLADGRRDPGFIAARLRASGLELLQLVENTLVAARIGSGTLRVHASEFPLAELVAELRESIDALPEAANGVTVRWVNAADLPRVRLDRLKLKEIVHNLVSNALKFTERGEVVVHIGCERAGVRVDVEDTGNGISRDAQARMFHMFERLDASPGAGGVGLGLYIVKSMTQLMGGSVSLTSEPGRGSRFTVWVPGGLEKA